MRLDITKVILSRCLKQTLYVSLSHSVHTRLDDSSGLAMLSQWNPTTNCWRNSIQNTQTYVYFVIILLFWWSKYAQLFLHNFVGLYKKLTIKCQCHRNTWTCCQSCWDLVSEERSKLELVRKSACLFTLSGSSMDVWIQFELMWGFFRRNNAQWSRRQAFNRHQSKGISPHHSLQGWDLLICVESSPSTSDLRGA